MVLRIEKLQRDFLWNDQIDKRKFHLVKWEVVCEPIVHVGLGIRSIENVNKSLIGKWLWRLGNSIQGLCRQIIVDKYKVQREGWYIPNLSYKASGFWKSLFSSVKGGFDCWIRYKVRDGRGIQFWHDERCGQSSLKNLFPSLYNFDRHPYAFIADNYQLLGGSIVWNLQFRRDLQDIEVTELSNLLTLLEMNYLSVDRMDKRIWKPDSEGKFSVFL